jgi:glycosyltransferase involved in cell wall biosynthesis
MAVTPRQETGSGHELSRAPTVIYIAGSGRSGSTLVERVLGEIPGMVNVGELIDLARRTVPLGERCGCGLAFADCPFWTGVGERAFGGWEGSQLADIDRLQQRVARQRHIPRLLAEPLGGRGFAADVAAYGALYAALYQAIADQAGAVCVVDASKWPAQALALSRAGIDVRVVHLVRDIRGVAHSLGKQIARPHAVETADQMSRNVPAEAAGRWLAIQTEAEMLRRCGLPVTRVRYEDFVRRPRPVIAAALAQLGLPPGDAQLAHVAGGHVRLGPSHGLSGNPSRFSAGEITLHADEAWRDQMPRRDRVLVTAIGLPLLLRYRWRLRAGTRPGEPSAASALPRYEGPWPLATVIMPTRARPELVRESIASVVAQDYPGDIECIVVHDQEPPDQELTRLGTQRRVVRVTANDTHSPGLAGARNAGLDLARGEFIASCDDDDTWLPGKLQAQVGRMLTEPDLLAVGSGIRLLLPDGKVQDWPGRADQISYQLLLRNRVKELHSSTLVMRREAFAKAGQYDEDLPNGYAEDYDWVLRVARAGRIGLVTEPLANIRKNAVSWYRGVAENACPGLEYMLAKHGDFASSRRGHARMLGQIAFARSALGQRGPALRYAVKALSRWPASPYPYIALAQIATGADPRHMLRLARLFRRGLA